MSVIDRPLSGDLLHFDLEKEIAAAMGAEHDSRTLVKQGLLRVTVVSLGPGDDPSRHSAPGPVTLQGLRGTVVLHTDDDSVEIGPGSFVSLGPGVPHRVSTEEGGVFLLTIVHPEESD